MKITKSPGLSDNYGDMPNCSNREIGGTPGHRNLPKPNVVKRFNKTMGNVDIVDQILEHRTIRTTIKNNERDYKVFARLFLFYYFDEMLSNTYVLKKENSEIDQQARAPGRSEWSTLFARKLIGEKAFELASPVFGPRNRDSESDDGEPPKKRRKFIRFYYPLTKILTIDCSIRAEFALFVLSEIVLV